MCNRESLAGSGFILEAAQSKLPGTMGYQDRDWYKDAQRDRPPVARKPAPPKRKGPVFSYILLWVVIGLVFYGLVTTFIPGMGSSRVQILRDGSVVLGTNRTGNYVINGSINGVSVRFVVDTGASLTSVSQRVARHMHGAVRLCASAFHDSKRRGTGLRRWGAGSAIRRLPCAKRTGRRDARHGDASLAGNECSQQVSHHPKWRQDDYF